MYIRISGVCTNARATSTNKYNGSVCIYTEALFYYVHIFMIARPVTGLVWAPQYVTQCSYKYIYAFTS